VGSDAEIKVIVGGKDISIHAPPWGATGLLLRQLCIGIHFNPRSPVGSDILRVGRRNHSKVYFNPRSPVGSDKSKSYNNSKYSGISIHAPPWGATLDCKYAIPFGGQFQSTLPRGERQARAYNAQSCDYFNPRSPVGSDSPKRYCYWFIA